MSDRRDRLEPFFADLRRAFIEVPDDETRSTHLSAITQAAVAAQRAPSTHRARRLRGRSFVRGAAVAAGFVLVSGSALAATGTLPDPVQDVVANAVDDVVDLPGGDKENGKPKNPIAAQNKAEAEAYKAAKDEYKDCRKAVEKASPSPEATDDASHKEEIEAECGEKPEARDFHADKTAKPEKTPKPEKTAGTDDDTDDAEKTAKPEKTDKPVKTAKAEKTPKA